MVPAKGQRIVEEFTAESAETAEEVLLAGSYQRVRKR
jgi:hypothetical protein